MEETETRAVLWKWKKKQKYEQAKERQNLQSENITTSTRKLGFNNNYKKIIVKRLLECLKTEGKKKKKMTDALRLGNEEGDIK